MKYSIEPKGGIYVKGYGFLSFAKNMVKQLNKKYGQKLLDSAKKSTTDVMKNSLKRAIQKIAEAIGDLIVTKLLMKLQAFQQSCIQKNLQQNCDQKIMNQKHQNKDTYLQKKRQQIIDELRLV